MIMLTLFVFFFFFNDTATTEIYTLSLHDALPISQRMDQRDDAKHHALEQQQLHSDFGGSADDQQFLARERHSGHDDNADGGELHGNDGSEHQRNGSHHLLGHIGYPTQREDTERSNEGTHHSDQH